MVNSKIALKIPAKIEIKKCTYLKKSNKKSNCTTLVYKIDVSFSIGHFLMGSGNGG